MDAALGVLSGHEPEFGGGLSDHGPMGVEALARLGRGVDTLAWACRYAERLHPASTGTQALRALLRDRIDAEGGVHVVRETVPLLVPGLVAGAFHAPIRVAHALRSLEVRDTAPRRAELAAGLAYWIVARTPLGPAPRVDGPRDPRAALACLPRSPDPGDEWRIAVRARRAADVAGFTEAIDGVELPVEPAAALLALAELGRDLLLAHPGETIPYLHAITGPLALATLVPHLDRTSAQEVVAFCWQAVAAVHGAYGTGGADPGDEGPATWDALVAGAVASGDEHAIKAAAACREADELRPDPRWRRAAGRAIPR